MKHALLIASSVLVAVVASAGSPLPGAAVVIEAADEAEAKALIAADPAVKNGIFTSEIHLWAVVPWDKYLKKR